MESKLPTSILPTALFGCFTLFSCLTLTINMLLSIDSVSRHLVVQSLQVALRRDAEELVLTLSLCSKSSIETMFRCYGGLKDAMAA
jgi:hypothetical protein